MQEEYGYTQQQGYGGAPAQQQGYGGGDGGYNPSYVQPAQAPQPPQASPGKVDIKSHLGWLITTLSGGYGDGQGYSDDKGQGYEEKRWDEHQEQQVEIHHEERQKHWYDLDEKRKKQLEVYPLLRR